MTKKRTTSTVKTVKTVEPETTIHVEPVTQPEEADPFYVGTDDPRQLCVDKALSLLRIEYRLAKNRLIPHDDSEPSEKLIAFVNSQLQRMRDIANYIKMLK